MHRVGQAQLKSIRPETPDPITPLFLAAGLVLVLAASILITRRPRQTDPDKTATTGTAKSKKGPQTLEKQWSANRSSKERRGGDSLND